MIFKTIRKCKVKDIFYCAEYVKVDNYIRLSNNLVFKIRSIRPSLSENIVIMEIITPEIGKDQMIYSDMPMNYSENIELIRPLNDVLVEL